MPYSFIRFPLAAASHNSMFFSAGVTYWAPAQGISLVTLMIESPVAWRPMASDAKCIRRGLSCQHAVGRAPEWPTGHSGACAHKPCPPLASEVCETSARSRSTRLKLASRGHAVG
eukprot:scaffold83691_cov38-Phaeocystis_antarctica.AAC.1